MDLSYRNVYISTSIDRILWSLTLVFLFIPLEKIAIFGLTLIGFVRLALVLTKKIGSLPRIILYISLLLGFSTLSYLIYAISYGLYFSYISYVFTGGYFFLYLTTSFYTRPGIYRWVMKIFITLTFVESILGIIQAKFYAFVPGDWTTGTLPNAHIMGFYTAYSILFTFFFVSQRKSLFFLVFFLAAHYLSDTKQFSASIVVGFFIFFLFYSNFFVFLRLIVVSVMVAMILPFFIFLSHFFLRADSPLSYLQYVPKVQGYMTIPDVFGENPYVLFLGTSPGTYASRAAVSLASPTVLAKESKENPIEENSPYLVKYLAPYYSPDFYEHLGNTGTFYTPFSSALAIIIEYGLIGCLLFFLLFRKIIGMNKQILKTHRIGAINIILTFALLMVFVYDNWFEHAMVMLPYLISLGYVFSMDKVPADPADATP